MESPCYVLHVKKGFEERELSICSQFSRLGQPFAWLTDYDIDEINPEVLRRFGYHGSALRPSEISCCLKHISAWERIAAGEAEGALVFEDDILIDLSRFKQVTAAAISEFHRQNEALGYLSLGDGCCMYVPWPQLRPGRFLYPAQVVRAADSYFLTRTAARLMLDLLGRDGFSLPADHLINRFCHELAIPIFWVEPTVVSQGSHTGRFASSLKSSDRGGGKEKLKWIVKKFRRKYLYPIFGVDLRMMTPEQRKRCLLQP